MKYIKKIYEFLKEDDLFKNEKKIKELLLKDPSFSKGDVFQALINIIHDKWQESNMSYDDILNWILENLGKLPLFAMFLAKYNYQVSNGGHSQYFDNGYASSKTKGFGSNYDNIDKHEDFVNLFKELDMINILPSGKKIYNIINNFELEFEDNEECPYCSYGKAECSKCHGDGSIDCEECNGSGEDDDENACSNCDGDGRLECPNCNGNGNVDCEECDGSGDNPNNDKTPYTKEWERLDDEWYEIDDDVVKEFNDYLISLTLDNQSIKSLIETQKYNL